jgi:hypothetical protein
MSYLRRLATRGAGARAPAPIRPAMMPVFPPAVGSAVAEGTRPGPAVPPLDPEVRRRSDVPAEPGAAAPHQPVVPAEPSRPVAPAASPAEPSPPVVHAPGPAEPHRASGAPSPPRADARASIDPPPPAPRRIALDAPPSDPAAPPPHAGPAQPARPTSAPGRPAPSPTSDVGRTGTQRRTASTPGDVQPVPGQPTAPVRPGPDPAPPPPLADHRPLEDPPRQGDPPAAKPAPAANLAIPPVPRTASPDAEPARPRTAAIEPVGVTRQEPPARTEMAPDRPVEVHIGTIEITAPPPPPRRQARGPVGFADYERLRTFAWDD